MRNNSSLSDVTRAYLCRFDEILEEMIVGMTEAQTTDSISHNFIVRMIPHHEAAIEMSRNLLQYTTCLPLQKIAQRIITEQTESIAQMRAAMDCCSELENTKRELCRYQEQYAAITKTMFAEMGSACADNDINRDFMREMIPHHLGAIRMSNSVLSFPICEPLKPILHAIIRSQRIGVQQMRRLLRCGC